MEKLNTIRIFSIIIFFVGVVIAISAGAKMPVAQATYPTTVGVFFVGLILAIVGNIVWHKCERNKTKHELQAHKDDEHSNPIIMLRKTIPALVDLQNTFSNFKGMELCTKIDEIQDQFIHPFTEKRKTFMDILGTGHGAEVLLIIAYAERMLNRVWSAQSDGYPIEAKNSLDDSIENYKKALAKMEEYNSAIVS